MPPKKRKAAARRKATKRPSAGKKRVALAYKRSARSRAFLTNVGRTQDSRLVRLPRDIQFIISDLVDNTALNKLNKKNPKMYNGSYYYSDTRYTRERQADEAKADRKAFPQTPEESATHSQSNCRKNNQEKESASRI